MQSTVRLILVLFVVALILTNYNSIKVLNLTLDSLNNDLDQRTNLITREISSELGRQISFFSKNKSRIEDFLQLRVDVYSLQGVVLYTPDYRPEIKVPGILPSEINAWIENPRELFQKKQKVRSEKFLLTPGNYQQGGLSHPLIVVFDAGRILRIERSTKIISYLNFLLMALVALLAFYFIESILRPYRQLLQAAKSAPASLRSEEGRNEADFLLTTFRSVIAKLKEKEQELARLHLAEKTRADEVQQLNQDLLRSISSGLILINQSGRICVFNHAAESILQIAASEMVDHVYDAVIQRLSAAFKEDIDRCFAERTNINRAELEIRMPQGDLRYLGANIMPLQDVQQNFAGVFCIFTDITEFKLLQQHMAQKEKFASLGEMAAGVAHEFRNSVATIAGYLQLLENKVGIDQKSYTAPIAKELELLQNVVSEFLSFARPVEIQPVRVSLGELLHECVEEVKVSSLPSQVEFFLKGSFRETLADEGMLRQVFTNLLRNAVESIDGTGRQGRVEVSGSTSMNGRFLVVEIRDNGLGIPQQNLSRIFTPFFSTKEKGVGLGLAIVQKLVLQHNGAISVESSPEGSTFRVQLPV